MGGVFNQNHSVIDIITLISKNSCDNFITRIHLFDKVKWIKPIGKIRAACLAIFFFLFTFLSIAQKENNSIGKITGRILDSLSGKPMEYVTISLLTQNEKK